MLSANHLDASPAEVTFGGIAAGGSPVWDRSSARCSATYCHGGPGGANAAPVWTSVGTGEAACGSCHGLPPPDPHPASVYPTGCATCHPDTMDSLGTLIPPSANGKHLDGIVEAAGAHGPGWMDTTSSEFHAYSANQGLAACQTCHGTELTKCAGCHGAEWKTSCTMCHGGLANATGAPPVATWARRQDQVAVGAHTSHVSPNPVGAYSGCIECHPVPVDAFSAGHVDGKADVRFAGPVSGLKPTAKWNYPTAPTCSSTYCHGNFIAGKTTFVPSWILANQAACGTCHNARPLGYLHKRHQDTNFNDPVGIPWWTGWITCDQCHDGITKSTSNVGTPTMILVNGAASPLHVDGVKTVVFKSGGTWNPQPFEGTCSGMQCHPGESKLWPR
jgi:predicted CxxxxCH...CXXCH cytochrome family protein